MLGGRAQDRHWRRGVSFLWPACTTGFLGSLRELNLSCALCPAPPLSRRWREIHKTFAAENAAAVQIQLESDMATDFRSMSTLPKDCPFQPLPVWYPVWLGLPWDAT